MSELQALAVETKRRNPEVRDVSKSRPVQQPAEGMLTAQAVDKALELLKTPQSNTFLRCELNQPGSQVA